MDSLHAVVLTGQVVQQQVVNIYLILILNVLHHFL